MFFIHVRTFTDGVFETGAHKTEYYHTTYQTKGEAQGDVAVTQNLRTPAVRKPKETYCTQTPRKRYANAPSSSSRSVALAL